MHIHIYIKLTIKYLRNISISYTMSELLLSDTSAFIIRNDSPLTIYVIGV